MADHTLRFYGDELTQLKAEVVRMGGLAESQVAEAVRAVATGDRVLAAAVVGRDEQLDLLQHEIERQAIRTIALRQPVANDLRRTVGALKLSLALERAGDYAKNIAKRALVIAEAEPVSPLTRSIERMGELVLARFKQALDAYSAGDVEAAMTVWARDEDVDEHYDSLFRELLTHMMSDPRTITAGAHLLFVAKNLERIGDYATTVAEIVRYEIRGEEPTDPRPKLSGMPSAPPPGGEPA
ncbi:MAG TPA: phosphate signaling complex protein PhoU [Caulobacteraceae bacterium]|nr:phosphate signaling complex protein PhoU [Caulobacteraceae bacterium]